MHENITKLSGLHTSCGITEHYFTLILTSIIIAEHASLWHHLIYIRKKLYKIAEVLPGGLDDKIAPFSNNLVSIIAQTATHFAAENFRPSKSRFNFVRP